MVLTATFFNLQQLKVFKNVTEWQQKRLETLMLLFLMSADVVVVDFIWKN